MPFTADDYRAAAANTRNNPKMQAMLSQAAEMANRLVELEALAAGLPREAVSTALEEIAARWDRDASTYPVADDARALGAATAVCACARELRAAAQLLQETP